MYSISDFVFLNMKYFISFLVFIFSQSIYAQQLFDICKIAEMERNSSTLQLRNDDMPTSNNFNIVYEKMEFEVDPSVKFIRGKISFTFISNAENTSTFDLNLSQSLVIDSVVKGSSILSFSWQGQDYFQIQLSESLDKNEIDSLTIYYHGVPNTTGFDSYSFYQHQGVPIMNTLSEPYGASDWMPCKNSLVDKIDSIDIFITTPKQYKAASNGVLQSEIINGNFKTAHWKHRYPIATYLVAMAITNYVEINTDFVLQGKPLRVQNYVYPEDSATAVQMLPLVNDYISFFSEKFGLYPFHHEKYGHAQFGWGGGMEHQTMSFIIAYDENLMAHELAHQWFGDKVTCGSFGDIWLNEGFATYCSGLCCEAGVRTNCTFDEWKNGFQELALGAVQGSTYCTDTANLGCVFNLERVYCKGAYILHMLRWKLGDEQFFTALKNYLNDERIAFNFSKTRQLQSHFEQICQCELDTFFDKWIYKEGYPLYNLKYNVKGNMFRGMLYQSTTHTSVSFYEMPVEITFYGNGTQKSIVVNHIYSGQEFTTCLPFELDSVKVDAHKWILCKSSVQKDLTIAIDSKNQYISPTIVREMLHIQATELTVKQVNIFSITGQEIIRSNECTIDVSRLSKGKYFVEIVNENGQKTVESFIKS